MPVRSIDQLKHVYSLTQDIIDNLDEYALQEIFGGYQKDMEAIVRIIAEETDRVLFENVDVVKIPTFGYLDKLTTNIDETLRKLNLTYFASSVLPDFEINWHHIEWGNFIHLYLYLCVIASRDSGKTIHGDTKVVMFDGSLKEARYVQVGDLLMGIDSTPRKVLHTHICEDKAYQIDQPGGGISYIVNSRHILHFKRKSFINKKKSKQSINLNISFKKALEIKKAIENKGERTLKSIADEYNVPYMFVINIRRGHTLSKGMYSTKWINKDESGDYIMEMSTQRFYKKSKDWQNSCFGYRVNGWDLPEKELPIDPYILGSWLGDGHSHTTVITNIDKEILKEWELYAEKNNLLFNKIKSSKYSWSITSKNMKNYFWRKLRELDLLKNKHIPEIYFQSSRQQRLELLAGIIDTDGYLTKNCSYEVGLKAGTFTKDIVRLSRSLGFRTHFRTKTTKDGYKVETAVIAIDIHTIPVRIKYKKCPIIKRVQDGRKSRLEITKVGRDIFYGFELDGDHLHLIEDGTVLHNSYYFSHLYPIWKMYRYEKELSHRKTEFSFSKLGMIITNEQTLARHLLSIVKETIVNNDILKEKLFSGKGEGWGNDEIICKNGARLMTRSYGARKRGFHPGYIVIDDFLADNVLYSQDQRDKYKNDFYGVLDNMLLRGGQIVCVGTPMITGDLYDTLKQDKRFRVFEYPSIYPDGRVLWPSRHPLDELLAKRQAHGAIIFSREQLVKPITDGSSIFPWEVLKRSFIGMDSFILVNNIYSFPKKFDHVVVGTDFAISANIGSDESVFIVLGVLGSEYYILHIYRGKGLEYDQQIAILKQINNNFNPDLFVIETNAMQRIFYQMATDAGLNCMEHTTGTEKWSLTEGLPALAVLFERGNIHCPRGDQNSIDLTDNLAQQLNGFTYDPDKKKPVSLSDRDDMGMSLWQGIRGARYLQGSFDFTFI